MNKEYERVNIPLRFGNIAGYWYGNRYERPVLTMHGWKDTSGTFALLAPALSKHVAILAIDMPGHARSSHLPTGYAYHIQDYVRVIREIMFYFKWPKISLMGHSMSALFIYMFIGLFPESVDVIISIDLLYPRQFTIDEQLETLKFNIEKLMIISEHKENNSTGKTSPPTYTFAELEQAVHQISGESIDLDKAKYILEDNIQPAQKHSNKYIVRSDAAMKYPFDGHTDAELVKAMAARMKNLKWLVIKAENSLSIDEENEVTRFILDTLRQNNPDFYYHTLDNVTHHCHLNNADKVLESILPFLLKYRSPEQFHCENKSKL